MIGGDAPALVIDHVQLAAPPGCEPAARRFYGGLLGLAESEKAARIGATPAPATCAPEVG